MNSIRQNFGNGFGSSGKGLEVSPNFFTNGKSKVSIF
jgi:hypothetical protein